MAPDVATCLHFIGKARDILFVGGLREDILGALDGLGCNLACLLTGDVTADEARVFCSAVEQVTPGLATLPSSIATVAFDAVVIDDGLDYFEDAPQVLSELRRVLREDGSLVVTVRNCEHGDVRLALMSGAAVDVPRLNAVTMRSLLLGSGYRIEQVQAIGAPLFGSPALGGAIAAKDFDPTVIAEIEGEAGAQVYQFVVKAIPLSIGAAHPRPGVTTSVASAAQQAAKEPASSEDRAPLDVHRELEAERGVRAELERALREAQTAAEAVAARVTDMATRRRHLESAVEEQTRTSELLRSKAHDLELRVADLAQRLAASEAARSASASSAQLHTAGHATLESALQGAQEALERARARVAAADEDWYNLNEELNSARAETADAQIALAQRDVQIARILAEVDSLKETAERDRAQAAADVKFLSTSLASSQSAARESQIRVSELQHTVRDLEKQIAQGSAYVASLTNRLAEKDEQIAQGSAYARSLETKIAELEAVTAAAVSERLVMREYINSLREQVAEIPLLREAQQQLVAQTEELIAQVQSESAQLVTLIDTVQASHFWKLKRWLNRLRAKVLGR